MRKRFLGVFILLLFVVAVPFAYADHDDDYEVGDVASAMHSAAPIPPGHFAIIAHYADRYLSNTNPGPGRAIPVTAFVGSTKTKNLTDYYILDIRATADYAKGHVPGAFNVPFATTAKPWNLVTYPTDRPILVICYTGHTASMTSSILNTLGYSAWVVKGGMSVWPCSNDINNPFYCEK